MAGVVLHEYVDQPNAAGRTVAVHSGKVADVEGPSTADGAVVHQWGYVGVLNQKWFFTIAP